MIHCAWLSKLLLLATVVGICLCSPVFDVDTSGYWDNAVPEDEALKFFYETYKDEYQEDTPGVAVKHSDIGNATTTGSRRTDRSITDALNGKGVTFENLTGGSFSVTQFRVKTAIAELGGGGGRGRRNRRTVKYKLVVESLPGEKIQMAGNIKMKKVNMTLTFKKNGDFTSTKIVIVANAFFKQVKMYTMKMTLQKDARAEYFRTTQWDATKMALKIWKLLGTGLKKFLKLIKKDLKTDGVVKMVSTGLKSLQISAAYNSENLQTVIRLPMDRTLFQWAATAGIKFITVITNRAITDTDEAEIPDDATGPDEEPAAGLPAEPVGQPADDDKKSTISVSVFVEIADLKKFVENMFTNATKVTRHHLLKHVKTKACVFLNLAETAYLDPIKKLMIECIGPPTPPLRPSPTTRTPAPAPITPTPPPAPAPPPTDHFEVISTGLHLRVKFDLKYILEQCKKEAPEPNHVQLTLYVVDIYARITADGVNCDLISSPEISTELLTGCFYSMMENAPAALTGGQVQVKQFNWIQRTGYFKLHLIIKPNPVFQIGSGLALKSLDLDAEKNGTWKVVAKVKMLINTKTLDISLIKEPGTFALRIRSSNILLSDIAAVFAFDDGRLKTLRSFGFKDFLLDAKFTDTNNFNFIFDGTPIILGYDKLQITANVKKSPSKLEYAVGIYMNGANFDSIITKLFGRNDVSLLWLSKLEAVAVFSNHKTIVARRPVPTGRPPVGKYTNQRITHPTAANRPGRPATTSKTPAKATTRDAQAPRPATGTGTGTGTATTTTTTTTPTPINLLFKDFENTLAVTIEEGIYLAISWTIPQRVSDCHGNGICKWMVDNLASGGRSPKLVIQVFIETGLFRLSAAMTDLSADLSETKVERSGRMETVSKLTFKELKLKIEVGVTVPKFQIAAKLDYLNEDIGAVGNNVLKLTGMIEVTPLQISLTFSMKNFIFLTKITKYVAIGDIVLGVGITSAAGLPKFVFGAAIKLGLFATPAQKTNHKHAIEIRGYFGINPADPADNWVYGSINALTIEKVCEAFVKDCEDIPSSLKKSGFPYGITASYSATRREVPGIGQLPAGLKVNGTINIFGFECYCQFIVNPGAFVIDIGMTPLNWANGMLVVRKNEKDFKNGPMAKAQFGGTSGFSFYMEGYANILNMLKTKVKIDISETTFKLKIEMDLIQGFLRADLDINAQYSKGTDTSKGPTFKFVAQVKLDFGKKLKQMIIDKMKDLQKKVLEAGKSANETAAEALNSLTNADNKVKGWKNTIQKWKEDLEAKKEEIKQKSRPEPCNCPKVCFPFMDWDSKCWKVWGHWVGCPYWNSCFAKIESPLCLAGCALKKVVNTIIVWTKQALLTLGQMLLGGVDALLALAQGVLKLAKGVVKVANAVVQLVLKGVNFALQMGAKALIVMLQKFKLRLLELSASLSADYAACVGYKYDLMFWGRNQTGEGEACLDIKSLGGALMGGVTEGNNETKGTDKALETVKEVETELVDVKNSENELIKEEGKAGKQVTKETKENFKNNPPKTASGRSDIPRLTEYVDMLKHVTRRSSVPSKEEMETTKLAHKVFPRYNVKEDTTMQSIFEEAPVPHRYTPLGSNATMQFDSTTGNKRSLDFESTLTPCARMERSLSGYTDITDGLLKYSKSLEDGQRNMVLFNRLSEKKIDNFRRDIESAALTHNMTTDETEDAYLVYSHLLARQGELVKRSKVGWRIEDAYAMPLIRRNINNLLDKEKGTTFLKYTDVMHANAVEGYKRSQIPHPANVQGEKILGNIKEELQSIVTDERSDLTSMTSRLQGVKKNIISMSEYTKTCPKK